jgi:hypothetical protein
MNRNTKWIISIAAAVVSIAAAVTAIIIFREQLSDLVHRCPVIGRRPKEYDDYADVE